MEERKQEKYYGLKKVLLADDDADDRDLFEEAVNFVDPTVKLTMTKDGEELMRYLLDLNNQPDLIFLDLNMPRKSGKECLNEIRKDVLLKNIPVIIYSTSLNPLDVDYAFREGAQYFFRKPNSFEELKEVLHKVFLSNIVNNAPIKENFVLNRVAKTTFR